MTVPASRHAPLPRAGWLSAVCLLLAAWGCTTTPLPPDKPHHTVNGFRNLHTYERPGFLDFLKWRWQRRAKTIPGPEHYAFPLSSNDPPFLRQNHDRTTLTWIGHATLLLQVGGRNILTDPHFSLRASPVQWAGPRRVVPPGIALEALPAIDLVVISHDHYDSLDAATIDRLLARPGGSDTTFVVPLRLGGWLRKRGARHVAEFDWWERRTIGGLEVVAVPVQHWSKRTLWGRNRTLWAGWVVRTPGFNFFFAGDSGYTPHFKEIGAALGPFDLAAIPIGAYEPRWFMNAHHITPEEALQVHRDVRAKKSVAIHWGTFILTDEPLDEPPRRLAAQRERLGLPEAAFEVLRHGQTLLLPHMAD